MSKSLLKYLLPDREVALPIPRGPFRGGVFRGRPRDSLRKILGLYEHELNDWLAATIPGIDDVIDVGANDGYFTFGCAAALKRYGKRGQIVAIEPQAVFKDGLESAAQRYDGTGVSVRVVPTFVGAKNVAGTQRLDAIMSPSDPSRRCLIKIDVEGAEVSVLQGAGDWMHPNTAFLIEVHEQRFIEQISQMLGAHGIASKLISQRRLPVLGRENRSVDNWWLVTSPAAGLRLQNPN